MKGNRYLENILGKLESAKERIEMKQALDLNSYVDDEFYSSVSYFIFEIKRNLSEDCTNSHDDYKLYMRAKRLYMFWSGGIW